MSYYTTYLLSCDSFIIEPDFPYSDPWKDLVEITTVPEIVYDEEERWYQHEADMIELSKRHPTIMFTLEGEGEWQGDVWIKHFKDGKVKVRKVITRMPEFDEVEWK